MTDKYLLSLWSKAVLTSKGEYCYNPECGQPAHSCHHIIRRKHKLTRYDVRNGLPLCSECHRDVQNRAVSDMDMIPEADRKWLREAAGIMIKDYLVKLGMTDKEFCEIAADNLKRIIREGEE